MVETGHGRGFSLFSRKRQGGANGEGTKFRIVVLLRHLAEFLHQRRERGLLVVGALQQSARGGCKIELIFGY